MGKASRRKRENPKREPMMAFVNNCIECGKGGGTLRLLKRTVKLYVHDQRVTPCRQFASDQPSPGTNS